MGQACSRLWLGFCVMLRLLIKEPWVYSLHIDLTMQCAMSLLQGRSQDKNGNNQFLASCKPCWVLNWMGRSAWSEKGDTEYQIDWSSSNCTNDLSRPRWKKMPYITQPRRGGRTSSFFLPQIKQHPQRRRGKKGPVEKNKAEDDVQTHWSTQNTTLACIS